jgi:hypothetical protein
VNVLAAFPRVPDDEPWPDGDGDDSCGPIERPVILDAFCKAGGAGMGYQRAGFEVVGTDIEPQPRYPFAFVQGDFFTVLPELVERYRPVAIHTSPVCKVHTDLKHFSRAEHVDQIPDTRAALEATGLPYVIENVEGAPLLDPVWLCGSMFGLGVLRHRGFELGHWKMDQPACRHAEQRAASPMYPVKRYHSGSPRVVMSPVIGVYGRGQGLGPGEVELWKQAMGIDWMVRDELSQAIPPAFAQLIGEQLLSHLAADPRPGPGSLTVPARSVALVEAASMRRHAGTPARAGDLRGAGCAAHQTPAAVVGSGGGGFKP